MTLLGVETVLYIILLTASQVRRRFKVKRLLSYLNFCSLLSLVPFVTRLRYADKRIVDLMKVYIERNNLQLELI